MNCCKKIQKFKYDVVVLDTDKFAMKIALYIFLMVGFQKLLPKNKFCIRNFPPLKSIFHGNQQTTKLSTLKIKKKFVFMD